MKISIVKDDNVIVIDDLMKKVDLSSLDDHIHVIQFDSELKEGMIWYKAKTDKGQKKIDSINQYQKYIDLWNTAISNSEIPPVKPNPELSLEQKLNRIGITLSELKIALQGK